MEAIGLHKRYLTENKTIVEALKGVDFILPDKGMYFVIIVSHRSARADDDIGYRYPVRQM